MRLLDVVALTKSLPGRGLKRGQVGTVVERLAKDVFEVEFCDERGRTYATLAIPVSDLIVLRYQPAKAA